MGMLANVLRLGWLVCALGLVAGCGGDPQDSDLRDLESLGLVTDQGQDAFGQSYDEIINRLYEGDAEVVDLFVRIGLIYDVATTIQHIEQRRNSDNNADIDRAINILQAADPVAVGRLLDEEARQVAMDNALSDVPDSYHGFLSEWCLDAVVFIALCVENTVDVLVQIFEEPAGPRRQFGVWVRTDVRNPTHNSHIIITEAGGGALTCANDGIYSDSKATFGGDFNDDGALTVTGGLFGTRTVVVQERGGVEFLNWGRRTYQRVTEPSVDAWEAYDRCR